VQICNLVQGLICEVMHKLNYQVIEVVTLFNKPAVIPVDLTRIVVRESVWCSWIHNTLPHPLTASQMCDV
jgi:hypothetical protein